MNEQHMPKPELGSEEKTGAERKRLERINSEGPTVGDDESERPDPNAMHQTVFGAPPVEPSFGDNAAFEDEHANE